MSSEILNFIEWKHSWSSYEFSCVFFNVLDVLTKNKKFWCFDSICLLLWIKFWFIIDWWWMIYAFIVWQNIFLTTHPNQLFLTYLSTCPKHFQILNFSPKLFPPSFFTLTNRPPYYNRVILGFLCNYIKFWYFCVFVLWPESLRFYVKAQKH